MTKNRVLIVDDSRFMRQLLCDVVNADPSFTVIATAGDGEEAVRLVEQLDPDIVTMDMEMPRMNGLEALRRIMAARSIPVIMLSAVTDNGMRDTIKALQYGAFDFVRKPDSTVKLDIREVCRYLLDKLYAAAESIRKGRLHMLPAVEEASVPPAVQPVQAAQPVQEVEPPAQQPPSQPPSVPKPEPPLSASSSTANSASPSAGPAPPGERPNAGIRSSIDRKRTVPLPPAAASKTNKTNDADKAARTAKAIKTIKTTGAVRANASKIADKNVLDPVIVRRQPLQRRDQPPPRQARAEQVSIRKAKASGTFHQVVAIGTSTGGPRALHEVLTKLPADFPAPILIVQHMPPRFTRSLAQRLNSFCNIRVCEAAHDDLLQSATAYIAPGGNHMTIARDSKGAWRIIISSEPLRNGHRPSVDVLFESLVGLRQLERHIVLMTGMGSDGAKGMKALKEDGVQTLIAESEETSVVYGMPRSAVELGVVNHELPLDQIAPALIREVGARSKMS